MFAKTKITILALALTVGSTAQALLIEDFETGGFGSDWVLQSGGGETVSAAGAHDGSFGVTGDGGWYSRTDVDINLGDSLSAWFKTSTSGGRFYLGFGADDTGASSFVASPNTGDIRFQNNPGYSYDELNTVAQSFDANAWYRLEVMFALSGDIIGNLYSADGTTLANSLLASGVTEVGGGIAVRSFGGISYDTIEILQSNQVPVPGTLMLFGLGLVGLGFIRKNKA